MPEATQTNKVAWTDSHACERSQESGPNRSQISSCAAGIFLHLVVCNLLVSNWKKFMAIIFFYFVLSNLASEESDGVEISGIKIPQSP
jgi:hypothetical protein